MIRVYIAGPYSSESVIGGLNNIRNGLRAAAELMLLGYSPYCPFADHLFCLQLRDGEKLEVKDYYNASLEWLYVSNAVLVLPGYEKSTGVKKEIEIALLNNIPVFYSLVDLMNHMPPKISKEKIRCHDCMMNVAKGPFVDCSISENPDQGYGCGKGVFKKK